jgi:hypothetical protein
MYILELFSYIFPIIILYNYLIILIQCRGIRKAQIESS